MADNQPPRWLEWVREIQSLAQTGYHFAENHYQQERFIRLQEIAAEMAGEGCRVEPGLLASIFNAQTGYATPRVDVRGAVFQDGKLLMVREIADGGWCMPGGWADVGDVPSESAEREVWEEAGYKVKARKVVGVYDANRTGPMEIFHAFKIVFLCDVIEGKPTPSNETSEVAFFGYDELPGVLSGERTKSRHIEDAFQAYKDPSLQTVFD
jgi:ADP-ribose pyrophosphatase YjhB (NUDIX family)